MRIFRKTAVLLLSSPLALLCTGLQDLLRKLDNIPFRFQQVESQPLLAFNFYTLPLIHTAPVPMAESRPSSSFNSSKNLKPRRLNQLGSVTMQQPATPILFFCIILFKKTFKSHLALFFPWCISRRANTMSKENCTHASKNLGAVPLGPSVVQWDVNSPAGPSRLFPNGPTPLQRSGVISVHL